MAGTNQAISVDRMDGSTVFSQVAKVFSKNDDQSSEGENVENRSEIKATSLKRISGKFDLLPLTTQWPESLIKWFGLPSQSAELHKAFFHSYDE
jgi:nitric oxide synthase oxygenase domain/subunit